jgi:hypothetical protein
VAEGRLVRGCIPFDDLVFGRLNLQLDAGEKLLQIFPG